MPVGIKGRSQANDYQGMTRRAPVYGVSQAPKLVAFLSSHAFGHALPLASLPSWALTP